MKAVVLTDYGDIDKLQVRQLPDPHAGPRDLVVRMAGASINPIDWKMRSGAARQRFPVDFPAILGRDTSGVVVEVGREVTRFATGDHVLGLVRGSYAELVTGPEESWAKLPSGLDLAEAGAIPLVALTGAQLIEEALNLPPNGATVLVTGAAGGVGRVAVYAAKARGANVWAAVRQSQREQAEGLGARVVAVDDDADVARLPVLDAIADTVGGDVIQKVIGKLKPGGVIGSVVGETPGAKERGYHVRTLVAHPDPSMLSRYAAAIAQGQLVIPIAKRFPLERAAEAQKIAETGHPGGKILLLG
jgi:NADPH:quinone reductase-like Zn-dependent oxidoreductase